MSMLRLNFQYTKDDLLSFFAFLLCQQLYEKNHSSKNRRTFLAGNESTGNKEVFLNVTEVLLIEGYELTSFCRISLPI